MIPDDLLKSYVENPHLLGHYLGYTDLIPLHSEWIVDAWLNDDCYAMQAHRNSYKTTSILIVGAIWYLLFFDPNATILIIRKAEEDAKKVIQAIQKHFLSKEIKYITKQLYGIEDLKTSRWSALGFTTALKKTITPENTIDCKGLTGNITGSHYDFIFPDDIISRKDRIYPKEREYTIDVIRELKNIIKEDGKIFYSGTPWHKMDGWKVIERSDRPIKKYPIGTVSIKGFLKKELNAKIAELKQGNTESLYTANYLLKHISDEARVFTDPVYVPWREDFRPTAYLDPAYDGDSTTALSLLVEFENYHGDIDYCLRGYVWHESVIDVYDEIVDILKQYYAGIMYIETNADKGLSVRDLSKKHPLVEPVWEKENKDVKIVGYGKQHWTKIKVAEDCQEEYILQILDYQPKQKPNDAPDSLTSLMRQMGFSNEEDFGMSRYSR
jgi:hypothetical protein